MRSRYCLLTRWKFEVSEWGPNRTRSAASPRSRSCGERWDGASIAVPMGVAFVLTHAGVRSAPGRSSGDDVDERRPLDAAAYLICARKQFELSPGCERNPAPLCAIPLPRSSGVVQLAFSLLIPIVWSAMLARCSMFVIGGQAVSKGMQDSAFNARE